MRNIKRLIRATEAERAFAASYKDYKGKPASTQRWLFAPNPPIIPSLCVDAACNGSPGKVEYRGVDLESKKQIFHAGPFADGTNNVGEFLAIVHALTWLNKQEKTNPDLFGFGECHCVGDDRQMQNKIETHELEHTAFHFDPQR